MPDHATELDRFFALSLELLCVAGIEDGYFKRLNPAWERTLGFSLDELLSEPFIDLVHPDDREASLAEVAGLAKGITIVSFENRFRHKDGSYVWVAWTATPYVEAGLLYAAGRDITERKRAEAEIVALNAALAERAARLEHQNVALEQRADELKAHETNLERLVDLNGALLEASVDAIRLVDLDGHTLLANTVSEQLTTEVFGLPSQATLQERSAIAERLTDPSSYRATMQTIADDPEYAAHDSFEFADDGRAFQRYTAPVRDSADSLIGRISVVREITAERESERLKSELVATVSHELRTPLTGVLGFTELLINHEVDEQTRKHYLQTIHGEAQRLTALIDDFLDLQKIEAGRFKLALAPFDLSELVWHQVEIFSALSGSHRLEFTPGDDALAIVGDRDRIGQVLANLLSNAIKYSPAGGTVGMTTSARDGFVRVAVADAGLGIPAAQQERVFTKFFRVDSSDTRAIGGTGLGLALCQDMVAAHGGRIGFDSVLGEGSTFWFDLPSARRTRVGDGHGRVLVIEDDAALTELLTECLMLDGLEVETAATGELGLECARANPPTVILLDVGLPGELDGWQVLTRLKTRQATAHIPVIVCTAQTEHGAAAAFGAADFVAKPFTGGQLRDTVTRHLPAARGSVLVVDDEEMLRRLIVETLTPDGRELREAADGAQALAMIDVDPPDLLLLDLVMPGCDGFEVLDRLRRQPQTRDLPVIVLTAAELTADERRFLAQRSAWLLEKRQYSGDELRKLIHLVLEPAKPIPPALAA